MAEEVLTPESPRWREFYRRLGAILKSPEDCHHDLYNAERVLRQMADVDVEETIAVCKSLGGHCDCEIMLRPRGLSPQHHRRAARPITIDPPVSSCPQAEATVFP